MDVPAFFSESRVLIVAGKGGVGKTTIAAALARTAAGAGLSVMIIELEGKAGLGASFGAPEALDYEETTLHGPPGGGRGTVRARRITPDDALLEYLADHGLRRVSKRLVSSGVIDVVATAIPGIRDVLVLGKVKQLERDRAADLIIVDAPATGHAVTFLTSATGLADAARGGPLRTQAADVAEMLGDPSRCRVTLVTLPEDMPVSETVEAAYQLEDRAGVQLGPLIVNGFDEIPPGLATSTTEAASLAGTTLTLEQVALLERARQFRVHRHDQQASQLARLTHELPLPQIRTPELTSSTIGPTELDQLASAIELGIIGLQGSAAS